MADCVYFTFRRLVPQITVGKQLRSLKRYILLQHPYKMATSSSKTVFLALYTLNVNVLLHTKTVVFLRSKPGQNVFFLIRQSQFSSVSS